MADVLLPLGDGVTTIRAKDMGDGSFARVSASGQSAALATGDKLVDIGDGVTKKRLRNMGDGSVAEVFYGV